MRNYRVVEDGSNEFPTVIMSMRGPDSHVTAVQSFLQNVFEETGGEVTSGRVRVWCVNPDFSDADDEKIFQWSAQFEPVEGGDDGETECMLELNEIE